MSTAVLEGLRQVRSDLRVHLKGVDESIRKLELLLAQCEPATVPTLTELDNPEQLVNSDGVRDLLKISRTTLARYRAGESPKTRPPFPKPCWFKGNRPHWKVTTILEWAGK